MSEVVVRNREGQEEDALHSRKAGLSPLMALQLAAPHTWPAAILPVLLATVVAAAKVHEVSVSLALALLAICILMQAATNALNDYYDFVKGADDESNQDDPTDAVLVYNDVDPRSALKLAVGLLVAAFALGSYVVAIAGWIPLAIGLVGALIIVIYSAGKSPLSYLPIGEFVSGITMGTLIPLASYYAFTRSLSWEIALLSIPLAIGIGLIMFTNNTSDIEKDIDAGRKTAAVLLGRLRARKIYHAALIAWIAAITALVAWFSTGGLIVVPFMLLAIYPTTSALFKNPLTLTTRAASMQQILICNITYTAFYCAAILFGATSTLAL